MAAMGRYIFSALANTLQGTSIIPDVDEEREEQPVPTIFPADRYKASVHDVLEVKKLLFDLSEMPTELIDMVIDFAEYWPHTSSVTSHNPDNPLIVRSGAGRENHFLLRSWPIGHNPSTSVDDTSQDTMTLKNLLQQSPPPVPQPWPASKELPDEATDELLHRWTADFTLCRGPPCRKIIFTIKSHDQGWGGSRADAGTYHGSYTWFDVGLERISASRNCKPSLALIRTTLTREAFPLQPQFTEPSSDADSSGQSKPITGTLRTLIPASIPKPTYQPIEGEPEYEFDHPLHSQNYLQKNKVAVKATTEHVITWSYTDDVLPESIDGTELEKQGRGRETATGEYVRNLKIGDVITVWAKARFQGWANFIEQVKVDVYWSV